MLHLLDARAGSPAEYSPLRQGVLRVCAYGGRESRPWPDISDLRVLLVTDLLARFAAMEGLQALAALILPGQTDSATTWVSGAERLGCQPCPVYPSLLEARPALGGPVDVLVAGAAGESGGAPSADDTAPAGSDQAGIIVPVGPVQPAGQEVHDHARAGDPFGPWYEWDPLAVRLALMRSPYHRSAELTEPALTSATETIRDWRHLVAEWADFPSRPIPAPVRDALRETLRRLDIASAMAALGDLAADESLPPGAKFETFVYADRILALELAREIGQPRGGR